MRSSIFRVCYCLGTCILNSYCITKDSLIKYRQLFNETCVCMYMVCLYVCVTYVRVCGTDC